MTEQQKALLGIVADVVGEELSNIRDEVKKVEDKIPTLPEPEEPYDDTEIKSKLKEVEDKIPTLPEPEEPYDDTEIKSKLKEVEDKIPTLPEPEEPYDDTEIKKAIEDIKPYDDTEIKKAIEDIKPYDDTEIKKALEDIKPYDDTEIKKAIEDITPYDDTELKKRLDDIPQEYDDEGVKSAISGLSKVVNKSLDFWKEGVTRKDVMVKHNNAEIYKALVDTAAEPSPYNDDWEMVQRGTRFEGTFDKDKSYSEGAVYIKSFSTFLVTKDKHVLMAARGSKGDKGDSVSIDDMLKSLDLSAIVKTIEMNVKAEYELKFKSLQDNLETYKKSFVVEQPKAQNFVTMEYLNEVLEEFSK